MNNTKTNVFQIILLIITMLLAGYIGYRYYQDFKPVYAENFETKKVKDVYDWCSKLNPKYACEFVYEDSKEFNKDVVFYQSVKENEKIDSKITFKVSSGLLDPIEMITIDENTTRVNVENWLSKNKIQTFNFIEEENENIEKGIVIRIEPNQGIYPDTPLNIYVSSGSKEAKEETSNSENIEVKYGTYIGNTVADFEKKAKALNLTPVHNSSRDAYSSTVKQGDVVWHGSGSYVKNENISYGISKGVNNNLITVNSGTYIGYSENDFIAKAKELSLSPNHNTSRDDYSDTVEKGKIVWHGSGTYEVNETFNYGLSLGKKNSDSSSSNTGDSDIEITRTQFRNITPDEFVSKTKALSLDPYHDPSVDDYSDDIEKGKVVWHGYGSYEKGEKIRYGLSLGKKESSSGNSGSSEQTTPSQNTISVADYKGKSESELTSFLSANGLKGNKKEQASSYDQGIIVSNDTGSFNPGATVNYVVSKGVKTASVMRPQYYVTGSTFDETKSKVQAVLADFTNVKYIETTSTLGVGQIEKILVNGDQSYSAGSYSIDTPIEVYIVSKQSN